MNVVGWIGGLVQTGLYCEPSLQPGLLGEAFGYG